MSRYLPLALARNDQEAVAKLVVTVCTSLFVIGACLAFLAYFPLLTLLEQFVSGHRFDLAKTVLIWGLAGFWLKALAAGICQSLVGAHQTPTKCKLMIAAWCLRLLISVGLLSVYGVLALPIGLVIESLFVVLAGRWQLQRLLRLPFANLVGFDPQTFRVTAAYGIRLQGARLATLVFEPVTRLVLGWLAGLDTLAFYDMASRLVTNVRQLITGAVQVAVPAIANAGRDKPEALKLIYRQMVDGSWLAGSLLMASLCVSMPLVSQIWLGLMQPTFIGLGWCLAIGWWFTLFGLPAYVLAVGLGWADIILISQWMMTLTGTVLMLVGGYVWGAMGSAMGIALALLVSTIVLINLTARRSHPSMRLWPPEEHWELMLAIATLAALGLIWFPIGTDDLLHALLLASLSLIMLSLAMMSHRVRRLTLHRMLSAWKGRHVARGQGSPLKESHF